MIVSWLRLRGCVFVAAYRTATVRESVPSGHPYCRSANVNSAVPADTAMYCLPFRA